MSKKLISLLIAVCILFCLPACGTTETGKNANNTPSESKTDTTQNTDKSTLTGPENNEISTKPENNGESTNTESSKESNTAPTQAPQNQTKPANSANQPVHTHSYSNATCTSPKKCSCGATAGTALGHQFSSATCTSPQICSRCGATSGNSLGHSYSAADCSSPKTCTRCGQTSGSALGHNYVNNKCSRCGKVDPDSLPVRLNSLYLIDRSFGNSWHKYEYTNSAFTDSFGNVYDGAHCYIGVTSEQYSTHNLDEQFSNFTGSIVATPRTSTAGTYSISIYVDGVLKYSKAKFSKTTGKVDFSVDVKGGRTLTIKACMDSGHGDLNMDIAVVNAQLTK